MDGKGESATTSFLDDLTVPLLDEVMDGIETERLLPDEIAQTRQEIIDSLGPRLEALITKAAERAARKFERRLRKKLLDHLAGQLPLLIDRELFQRMKVR